MARKSPRRNVQMRAKAAPRKSSQSRTAAPKRANAKTSRRKAKSSRAKVQAYRQRMREKGFRLMQMWLPDTSSPEFKAQAHRSSLAIANSPTETEDQAFIDSVQWWTSDEFDELAKSEPEGWFREPSD